MILRDDKNEIDHEILQIFTLVYLFIYLLYEYSNVSSSRLYNRCMCKRTLNTVHTRLQ